MIRSERIWILLFGLFFVIMLGTSLWQRFTHPDLVVTRTSANMTAGDSAMAGIGSLMEAAAKNPGNREILLHLVESLIAVGQWESAENFAQKALALDKPGEENPRATYLLAVAHHNQGRHAEAAELLEKMLAKSENPSARYSLGILYIHYMHDPVAGIAQLEKGLQSPGLSAGLERTIRDELVRARATLPPASPVEEP